MKRNINNDGFTVVEVLLVLVVVAILGSLGYLVWHSQQKAIRATKPSTTSTTSKQGSAAASPLTKTFANQQANLTFKYPASWTSKSTVGQPLDDGSLSYIYGTLTAPSGRKLDWDYQIIGGKGDAGCTLADGDIAFATGNNCDSKQIYSVVTTGNQLKDFKDENLYLTETKYLAPGGQTIDNPEPTQLAANKVSYQICLDAEYPDSAPKVGTTMGFLLPCEFWDTGFNAIFTVKDKADFSSSDAQTAILIMKSFNTLE